MCRLVTILVCSTKPGANEYGVDGSALNAVWRSFYLWGLIMIIMNLLYRWLILDDETDGHRAVMERKKLREERLGKSYSLFTIIKFYMFRILGTGK
jgi:hypothetical protein